MAKGYKVKAGDNLWSIAEKLYGDGRAMKRLMYINGMTSSTIRPGQVLRTFTAVAGKNDRYTITNADIERQRSRNEMFGGTGYGLATTGEIASGQAGAGAGPQKTPGVAPENDSRVFQSEKLKPPASSSFNTYADTFRVPGQAPTSVISQGVSLPKPVNAGPYQTGVDRGRPGTTAQNTGPGKSKIPTYNDTIRVPGQAPTSVQSQGPSGYVPPGTPTATQHGSVWMGAGVGGQQQVPPGASGQGTANLVEQVKQVLGSFGLIPEALQSAGQTVAHEFNKLIDTNDPQYGNTGGSFYQSGGVDPIEYAMQNPKETPYALGTFSQTNIEAWQDFQNPATQSGYRYYLEHLASGGTWIPIPADVVLGGGSNFGYTPEQMRLMGYHLDPETDYYIRGPVAGSTVEQPGNGNLVGSGAGGGGGSYGGGGGYSGGGGYGDRRPGGGGSNQNENAAYALFRGMGSWKGANFG